MLVSTTVDASGERAVLGVIDFGDLCHSWLVNEIAIAAAYASGAGGESRWRAAHGWFHTPEKAGSGRAVAP